MAERQVCEPGRPDHQLEFPAFDVAPNEFFRNRNYAVNRTASWTLTLNNGPDTQIASTLTAETAAAVPFVTNIEPVGLRHHPHVMDVSFDNLFDTVRIDISDVEDLVGTGASQVEESAIVSTPRSCPTR